MMSLTVSRQTHIEQVLVEVTSLLMERARVQLEREHATDELHRVETLEKELKSIRHELGLDDAHAPPGRQVSKFHEVPGQEDA
jgi:hypothetical protein